MCQGREPNTITTLQSHVRSGRYLGPSPGRCEARPRRKHFDDTIVTGTVREEEEEVGGVGDDGGKEE